MSFEDLVDVFAQQVSQLLAETLPTLKGDIAVEKDGGKALIKLVGSAKRDRAIATTGSRDAAQLHVMLKCRMDSAGRYLAVSKSTYALYAVKDDEPLFRLEYIDDMRNKPACHWQVHAERGALSYLLTLSRRERPHMLSALHIPVGGARMRPGLEDFLQFAIEECGLDAGPDYQTVLEASRSTWRRRQIATLVRDVPDEAVRVLTELGYTIDPPAVGAAPVRRATLTAW